MLRGGVHDILRLTLEHGADPRSTNRCGGTALIPASEHAHVETVRLLLAAGADPSIPDGDGVLPRRLAAQLGDDAIVAEIDAAN